MIVMRGTLLPWLLAVLALVAAAQPARAQINELGPDVARASPLGPEQRRQIQEYVRTHAPGLAGEDVAVRRARAALLSPLLTEGVSVPFRLEYQRALLPELQRLAGHERDLVAVNVLRLAGELATPSSLTGVVVPGLSDKRAPVRYAAAAGVEQTFVAVSFSAPAITAGDLGRGLRELGTVAGSETDPLVLDAIAGAFDAGMRVPDAQVSGFRNEAVTAGARVFGDRARAAGRTAPPPGGFGTAFLRLTRAVRDALTDVTQQPVPAQGQRDAAELAGHMIGYAGSVLRAGDLGPEQRSELAQLVNVSEAIVYLAGSNLGARVPQTELSRMVQDGRDDEFARAAASIVGPEGALTRPPYGLPKDRF